MRVIGSDCGSAVEVEALEADEEAAIVVEEEVADGWVDFLLGSNILDLNWVRAAPTDSSGNESR